MVLKVSGGSADSEVASRPPSGTERQSKVRGEEAMWLAKRRSSGHMLYCNTDGIQGRQKEDIQQPVFAGRHRSSY